MYKQYPLNAFATGNPSLGISIGRGFEALKGFGVGQSGGIDAASLSHSPEGTDTGNAK